MEEQLFRSVSDSQYRNKPQPGRMWGILHILDYHNWHTVKKILPYKKHGSSRNGSVKDDKTKLDDPDTCEAQEFEDSEVAKLLAEEKMSGTSPTKKISRKARSKKLSAEEIPKEEGHKHKISVFPSRLLRTDSIHHLEPSHRNLPDEIRTDDVYPSVDLHEDDSNTPSTSTSISLPRKISFHKRCEVCGTISAVKSLGPNQLDELRRQLIENLTVQDSSDKSKQAFLKQKSVGDQDNGDAVLNQSKEVLDALEMFSIKKELLLTILQDPDYALAHHFQGLWASNAKRGLAKSGSFPVSKLNIKPIKLKYKQSGSEVLDGKLGTENPTSTLNTQNCSEGNHAQIEEPCTDSVQKAEQVGSSLASSHDLKKRGRRFKDIKHKIKNVIKESRKEGHRISMDAILHKIPYGRKFSKNAKREMTTKWKEGDTDCKDSLMNSYESDSCGYSTSKGGFHRMRRSPSLNESLDKYSRLFESSFNREAKKHLSHGRKLSSEDACSTSGRPPKSFGRILSLPDLESYCAFQNEDLNDTPYSEKSTEVTVDSGRNDENLSCDEQKNQIGTPVGFAERSTQENLVEVDESTTLPERDEMGLGLGLGLNDNNSNEISKVGESEMSENLDPAMAECSSNSQSEQEHDFTNNASSTLPQPSPPSVLDFSFQEDAASPVKLSISEGQELTPRHIHFGEPDSLGDRQDQSGLESPSAPGSTTGLENIKIPSMDFDSEYLQIQVDEKDEADFIYVRDVLKLSGFTGNQCLGTWHSADQPVDPLLFKELEGFTPHKLECTAYEAASIDYDHQLLFDIINEVLLEIYERSFTYWPLPLSSTSSIRPMPIGYHVLEEVWSSICWYLNSPPADDPSLDYVMARDLAKADGWMNLQVDMECVGLELEEMILDDLLEEVIYS